MRRIIMLVVVVLSATSAFVSPVSAAETPEANEYADQLDAARGTGTDQHVGDPGIDFVWVVLGCGAATTVVLTVVARRRRRTDERGVPPRHVSIARDEREGAEPLLIALRRTGVPLDEELILGPRQQNVATPDKSDALVLEDALAVEIGMKALDASRAQGTLSPDEADRLAVEEVGAVRMARRGRVA